MRIPVRPVLTEATTDEGLTPDQLARVQSWESALIDVIKQEMLHLALATNILTAVGAAPHFGRPNLPILSRWYPPDVQIALLPFGEQALRHFMYLERPEGMTLADAEGFAVQPGIAPLATLDRPLVGVPEMADGGAPVPGDRGRARRAVPPYGEDAVFIGPPAAQAVTATFEWKELTAVTDLASASGRSRSSWSRARARGAIGSGRTSARSWGSSRTSWRWRPPTRASIRRGRSRLPTSGCHRMWRREP